MLIRRWMLLIVIALGANAITAQNKPDPAKAATPAKAEEAAKPAEPAVKAAPVAEFKPLGFLGFAYAEGTYVLTCGGPKLGFTYGAFGMAAGFYPSLVYSEAYKLVSGGAATPVRPTLGAGIEFSYGKVALILPVYYLTPNSYYYTIGIGYKF